MKGKLTALLLAVGLCLSSLPAVSATADFSDVAPDAWYASAVDVCVDKGVMNGIGSYRFAPNNTLSSVEATVLALRIYDILHGGNGDLGVAPDGWGYLTVITADGRFFTEYLGQAGAWQPVSLSNEVQYLGLPLETQEFYDYAISMNGTPATATYAGVNYYGTLGFYADGATGRNYLTFVPENYQVFALNIYYYRSHLPLMGAWYTGAWYYAMIHGFWDEDLFLDWGNDRLAFAQRIALVTDLPAINTVRSVPDTDAPFVLELYNAGILQGRDPYGTFDGSATLTRAEAAAMVARVLDPSLRLRFTLAVR